MHAMRFEFGGHVRSEAVKTCLSDTIPNVERVTDSPEARNLHNQSGFLLHHHWRYKCTHHMGATEADVY